MTPQGAATNPDTATEGAWIRTTQLLQRGQWDEAHTWIQQILSQYPSDIKHLLALTECQLGQNQPKEARKSLSRLFAEIGPEALLLRLQSRIDLAEGRTRDALRSANAAVSADPADPDNHVAVARCACARNDWDTMEASLRNALQLDAQHDEALHLLSVVRSIQGDTHEGQDAARQLLRLDPESATGHSTLGWVKLRAGEYKEAGIHFRKSLQIDPSNPSARAGLLESLRARNPAYRAYLSWTYWLQSLSAGRQSLMIFGMFGLMQVAKIFKDGWAGIASTIAIMLYFVAVMWSWMAPGVGNLFLWFDRNARILLQREEKLSAIFVGGFFLAGMITFFSAFALASTIPVLVGGSLLFSAIASSMAIGNEHPIGKWVYAGVAFAGPTVMVATILGLTTAGQYLSIAFLALTIAGSFRFLRS